MMNRAVVKAHRSVAVFHSDIDEWEVEVSEPETPKVFRFPDDSEED